MWLLIAGVRKGQISLRVQAMWITQLITRKRTHLRPTLLRRFASKRDKHWSRQVPMDCLPVLLLVSMAAHEKAAMITAALLHFCRQWNLLAPQGQLVMHG
jgi:hypothetical protein